MPVWLGEAAGQVLWRSTEPGVAFIGAQVAVVCGWIGVYVLARRLIQRWRK